MPAEEEKKEEQQVKDLEVEAQVEQKQWDKERQFRDELAAANRKQGEVQAQLDNALQELEQLRQEKMAGTATEKDLDDYDNLKEVVSSLIKENKEKTQLVVNLQKDLGQVRNELGLVKNWSAEQEGLRLLNLECDKLDKEFGAELRNSVLQEVNQEYLEAEVSSMPDKPRHKWIKDKLRLAYMEKAAAKKKDTKSTSKSTSAEEKVDTGQGGTLPSNEIKEGTLDEIEAQLKARPKR